MVYLVTLLGHKSQIFTLETVTMVLLCYDCELRVENKTDSSLSTCQSIIVFSLKCCACIAWVNNKQTCNSSRGYWAKGSVSCQTVCVLMLSLHTLILLWYWRRSIIDRLYQNRCPQRLMTASRAVSRQMLHSKVARSLSRSPSAPPPDPAPPPLPGTPAPLAAAPSLELRCCSAASILFRSHSLTARTLLRIALARTWHHAIHQPLPQESTSAFATDGVVWASLVANTWLNSFSATIFWNVLTIGKY